MVQIRQARKKLARIGMLHGISQIFLSNMFLEKGSRMILNDNNKGILGGWRTHYGNYQKYKPENMTNTKFLHFFKPFPLVTVASIDKISGVLFFCTFYEWKSPRHVVHHNCTYHLPHSGLVLFTCSTCGLAEELEQGKTPAKKTVTSSCGSVSPPLFENGKHWLT